MTILPSSGGGFWTAALSLAILVAGVALSSFSPRTKRLLAGLGVAVILAVGVYSATVCANPYNCCSPIEGWDELCTVLWICLCPCPYMP